MDNNGLVDFLKGLKAPSLDKSHSRSQLKITPKKMSSF